MKSKKLISAVLLASIATLTSLVVAPSVMANDHETQCFNDIQGRLPWDDDKFNWDAKNVKQLCKGTTKPTEPGKCFAAVRTGRVNWGKGTDWEWQNIINLCAGTDDADKTVECFKKGIAAGSDWRDAILLCQRNKQEK